MYGATFYNPGLTPYRSGIKDPAGTVALAAQAHLNTLRITDFLDTDGDPTAAPFDESAWRRADAMISAAAHAGMHVVLGLSDYRADLWNNCIDPYTSNWNHFIDFVANRVNTVSGHIYKNDPAIAFVSLAGEPLPVGVHHFTAKATGKPCTISYTTQNLTDFYATATREWKRQGAKVLVNTGGLGYLNESTSGIDWKAIFSLASNDLCDIKTYGGMQAWAPNAARYCASIAKPLVDEEFGWQQGIGDPQRASAFERALRELRSMHVSGIAFWNLGYEVASTSYEVSPLTPKTFATVRANAPPRRAAD
jgi:hypothetical protein